MINVKIRRLLTFRFKHKASGRYNGIKWNFIKVKSDVGLYKYWFKLTRTVGSREIYIWQSIVCPYDDVRDAAIEIIERNGYGESQ